MAGVHVVCELLMSWGSDRAGGRPIAHAGGSCGRASTPRVIAFALCWLVHQPVTTGVFLTDLW
jgi:hypothetical protein